MSYLAHIHRSASLNRRWLPLPMPATDTLLLNPAGIEEAFRRLGDRFARGRASPDLVARDGELVTRRRESKDPAFRSRMTVSDEEADQLIRWGVTPLSCIDACLFHDR